MERKEVDEHVKAYVEAKTMEEVQQFIQTNQFAFVYVSRVTCSVCHAVFPQLQSLLEHEPSVSLIKVDADLIPTVAGEFSVFTVPVLLFFVDGKEMIRKARFVVMDELAYQIRQITSHY